jgi:hypothetical protein
MMDERSLFDELTGADNVDGVDRIARDATIRLANRQSRRSLLAKIGRVTFITLGGSVLTALLHQEDAFADPCFSGVPSSCLCKDLSSTNFKNQCRDTDCPGGHWLTCITDGSFPPAGPCRDPINGVVYYRKFQDCCSTCTAGCKHVSCGGVTGDVCCNSEPSQFVYCNNCGGSCSNSKDTVHCVVTNCSTVTCA